MKHCKNLSKVRIAPAQSPMEMKFNSKIEIIDRLLMAQRQAAWKTPFPIGYEPGTPTDPGTGDPVDPGEGF